MARKLTKTFQRLIVKNMKQSKKSIDVNELKKTFRLNPEGKLERLFPRRGWVVCSTRPVNGGYAQCGWKGRRYMYHRIVWAIQMGYDPAGMEIDHIDGNRTNNSISNMRLVSLRGNQQNKRCHREGKLVGASYRKEIAKWGAWISIEGKSIYLGSFESQQAAHEAYRAANITWACRDIWF
jgi:hypothetical protein